MELLLAATGSSLNSKVNVSESTFGQEFNEALVHQVMVAYLAGGRAGTRAQKTRSEVSGGGAKPWNQKGTGRARAGTSRSPIWRSGGRAFAAKPQDHSQKVNKKMYRGAMRSILSELARQDRILVVNDIVPSLPKTRELLGKLNGLDITNALIVVSSWDANLYLAARNIPGIDVKEATMIDPVSLLKYKKVLMTEDAVRKIEEVLG